MRVSTAFVTTLLVGLLSTAAAAHAEHRDAFAKRVAKFATDDPARPKALCHCHDTYDTTGYVVLDSLGTTVNVQCKIPEFNYMNGDFIDEYITCAVAWDVLGK